MIKKRILVTGGAGFIGSALCRHLVAQAGHQVLNVDKLTYAANLKSLDSLVGDSKYQLAAADICDADAFTGCSPSSNRNWFSISQQNLTSIGLSMGPRFFSKPT